ncbi:hypothetical protein [Streptomyces sp. NPDC093225]|uniref:hypothetical protein n=1 Tax=Streptomyces sp. NPDC093225 TaxID=3366034 RepID=UPI0038045458
MARRHKKAKPPFPMPTGLLLLETAGGWRHAIRTRDGGSLCGRLADVPVGAAPEEARRAAAAMLTELVHDVHGARVEVVWEPPAEPGSWTALVRPAGPSAQGS